MQANKLIDQQHSVLNQIRSTTMATESQEAASATGEAVDTTTSPNKHLTRLVRFSILQARRTSSKAAQGNKTAPPPPIDTSTQETESREQCASPPVSTIIDSINNNNNNNNNNRKPSVSPTKRSAQSPLEEPAKFPFGFSADKERPTTEVAYKGYNTHRQSKNANNNNNNNHSSNAGPPGHVGVIPGDPPIMEDLSQSFTQGSMYNSASYSEATNPEDMHLLLAPDSEGGGAPDPVFSTSMDSSNYDSAEMYSRSESAGGSSSDYVGGSHSSDSSDSIMRRVEAEIANARKASSDAQARLAFFTQRQKDLTPASHTDSYSFDFDSLVDVGDLEDNRKQQQSAVSTALGNAASPRSKQRGVDPPVEDNFENAMGVIGQEFDSNSNDDVDIEEKVDIEVVLAPSEVASPRSESSKQRSSPRHSQQRSPRHHRKATGSPAPSRQKSPRYAAGDSVDVDEAVISAAFSEKSIESLPVKESLPAVFSEQSFDSLPTQASSVGIDKNSKPIPLSFQDMGRPSDSPAHRRPNKLPAIATQGMAKNSSTKNTSSPMKSPSKLTIDTEAQLVASPRAASVVSPTNTVGSANSFSSRRSKLPATPREPGTPSYRERLENKLKILGSRYPASPVRAASASPKQGTPKTKSDYPKNMENAPSLPTTSPTKTPKSPPPPPREIPRTPKEQNIASPSASQVASPLGEAYDGLENRIKDLLARTLNPTPEDLRELSDKDCPTSPSAELKAIKKLLEQGVAAAEAAEETKVVEKAEPGEKEMISDLVAETTATMESLNLHGEGKEVDLDFPDLNETLLQEVNSIKEEADMLQVAARKATADFRLSPRTSTPVAAGNVAGGKYSEPPAIACSTSEEILEQLDSFSNSNEFKSKAWKPAVAKPAPTKVAKQENGGKKAGKTSPLKKTKRELGEKTTPRASPTKSEKQVSEKKQGTISTIKQIIGQIMPDSTPEMQTVQTEPVPSDEICQNDSLVSPASYKAPAMWESCGAEPEVEAEVEFNIADAISPPKPEEKTTTTSPKKTPSVLNLALSRPSLSPASDQNLSEKNTAATFSEKIERKVPVAAASNQVSVNNTDKVPAVKATPIDEVVNQKVIGNAGQAVTEKDNSSSLKDAPTKKSTAVEATSMIASLIAIPGSNLHSEAVPDRHEKAENKKPPSNARVKSVTLVSPKSAELEHRENTPPPVGKENPKPRTSSRQDRKIRFRDPYPTPTPNRKPRSTEEIQLDHSCKPTAKDGIVKWKDPKGDLKRLLVAALDSSVSRRSNACGALKVISKLEKNKVVLVRTKGFLDALVFVATDEVAGETDEAKQDARARAISCIYNVSHVKGNRLTVCLHPGLLECLVKTLSEDRGEARMEACGTLAQLAKNPMCRERMVEVDDLLSTLASVLKGTIDPEEKMMDMVSQDFTEEAPSSSYSEMSSVLSEEHIPFPKKSPRSPKHNHQVRSNFSIRKQKSEMYDQYFNLARLSACAALIHLSKQCSVVVSYIDCSIRKRLVYLWFFVPAFLYLTRFSTSTCAAARL